MTAPLEDGWIEWNGGECPVEPGTMVELRLKEPSAWDSGDFATGRPATAYDWQHNGNRGDIIAYRVVHPK